MNSGSNRVLSCGPVDGDDAFWLGNVNGISDADNQLEPKRTDLASRGALQLV